MRKVAISIIKFSIQLPLKLVHPTSFTGKAAVQKAINIVRSSPKADMVGIKNRLGRRLGEY
jgi:hypothetical protein